ncbi:MAG: hypothetical protein EOM61_09755 [Bacteroidia bacterium]|nr:hypothetical protein [Bacteroidia bacterium]
MATHIEARDLYPGDERKLWEENQMLQEDLKQTLISLVSNEEEKEYVQAINADGFYPFYTHQKVKILFIGKEALGLQGNDYIESIFRAIISNDPRGQRHWNSQHPDNPYKRVMTNNSDPFLSKMLYITYGLNNGCCKYGEMPWASNIGQNLFGREMDVNENAERVGISYAFMNFSKFDNPSETSYTADANRIQSYANMVKKSGINWFSKQISLLNPDLIIELNIGHDYADMLGDGPVEWYDKQEALWTGYLPVAGKKRPIFETYHFSCPGRKFERDYYLPIVKAWQSSRGIQK